MSNTKLRQNKLRRLVFAPESALGTMETLGAASPVVPASNVSMTPSRGTRMISRAALVDGYHGEAPAVQGSFAWELSFDCELHHYAGYTANGYDVYWTQLLQGCGFKAEDDGLNTLTLYPTQANMGDWDPGAADDGFTNPCALSFGYYSNNTDSNDEPGSDSDSAHFMRGSTGNVSFNLTTGQLAQLSFNFKGLVENDKLIDTTVSNVAAIGTFG